MHNHMSLRGMRPNLPPADLCATPTRLSPAQLLFSVHFLSHTLNMAKTVDEDSPIG
ncbi:hypothetical protein L249_4431, partial [Ophiocordyceps polyrhachis-furcata BCC 54312]